jgi:pimeloyl-ACP methyl ester carboxylesterase
MFRTFSALALVSVSLANDNHKSIEQITFQNGYSLESYSVVTTDGYVSQIYRIPGKLQEVGKPVQKPAVLMMHGLMCDMNFWLANDAKMAPPFILVDQGYDVWLGNNRGNRFAQAHLTLNKDEQAFWETNYIDMGTYDTPAFIDFVLEKTNQSKLTYIGHS